MSCSPASSEDDSMGAASFLRDLGEQSLLSSTQHPRQHETQRHALPADDLLSYFLDSDYETEYESSEHEEPEKEDTLVEPQDSIDEIVNRTPRFIEATVEVDEEDELTGCESIPYQPSLDVIRQMERYVRMGVTSTPKKARVGRTSLLSLVDPMDSIDEELDSLEVVDDLEKAAIYSYLETKEKKKYLYDGENMIRLKPKRNAALTAVIGKVYWLRRKLQEKLTNKRPA